MLVLFSGSCIVFINLKRKCLPSHSVCIHNCSMCTIGGGHLFPLPWNSVHHSCLHIINLCCSADFGLLCTTRCFHKSNNFFLKLHLKELLSHQNGPLFSIFFYFLVKNRENDLCLLSICHLSMFWLLKLNIY